jgi:hypothetical protein
MLDKRHLIMLFLVLANAQTVLAQSATGGYHSNPSTSNSSYLTEPYGINLEAPSLRDAELYTRHHRLGPSAGLGSSSAGTTSDTAESMPAISGHYQLPTPAAEPTSPYSNLPVGPSFNTHFGSVGSQGPTPQVQSLGSFAPGGQGFNINGPTADLIGRPGSFAAIEGSPILPGAETTSPALTPYSGGPFSNF